MTDQTVVAVSAVANRPPALPKKPKLPSLWTVVALIAISVLLIFLYAYYCIYGAFSLFVLALSAQIFMLCACIIATNRQAFWNRQHFSVDPAKKYGWEAGQDPDLQRTQADLAVGNNYRLEFTKHLLTLAVGTLAFTTAFGSRFAKVTELPWIMCGWAMLVASIFAGSLSLYYWELFYVSYHADYGAIRKYKEVVDADDETNHPKAKALADAKEAVGRAEANREFYKTVQPQLRGAQLYLLMMGLVYIVWFASHNLELIGSQS